jgi:hypothetical protein
VTVPEPLAAAATVVCHPDEPTLIVKAPGNGYAALLWREGHQALMQRRGGRPLLGTGCVGAWCRAA